MPPTVGRLDDQANLTNNDDDVEEKKEDLHEKVLTIESKAKEMLAGKVADKEVLKNQIVPQENQNGNILYTNTALNLGKPSKIKRNREQASFNSATSTPGHDTKKSRMELMRQMKLS